MAVLEYYGEMRTTFVVAWSLFLFGLGCYYAGTAASYCDATGKSAEAHCSGDAAASAMFFVSGALMLGSNFIGDLGNTLALASFGFFSAGYAANQNGFIYDGCEVTTGDSLADDHLCNGAMASIIFYSGGALIFEIAAFFSFTNQYGLAWPLFYGGFGAILTGLTAHSIGTARAYCVLKEKSIFTNNTVDMFDNVCDGYAFAGAFGLLGLLMTIPVALMYATKKDDRSHIANFLLVFGMYALSYMSAFGTDSSLSCNDKFPTHDKDECAGSIFGTLFTFAGGALAVLAGILPSAMQPHQLKALFMIAFGFFFVGFGSYFGGKTTNYGDVDSNLNSPPDETAAPGTAFGTLMAFLAAAATFYGAYQSHQPDFIEKNKEEIQLHRGSVGGARRRSLDEFKQGEEA